MRRWRDAPHGWPGVRGRRLCSQPAAAGTAAPRPSARRRAPDRTRREGSCGSSESAWCRCAQSRPVTRSQAHRPGGPQVDAPRRGRRLGRSGAPRGEAAAATGVCEVLAQGHARASNKRTAGRGGSLKRLCLDAAPGCCSRPVASVGVAPLRTTALISRRPGTGRLQGRESGRPGESHPRAPSDPGVTVSRHRALLIGPSTSAPGASGRTGRAVSRAVRPATGRSASGCAAVCISCQPSASRRH